MSGLGILLEESESPGPLRAHLAAPSPRSPAAASSLQYIDTEALLPPLPDTAEATTTSTSPLAGSTHGHVLLAASPALSGAGADHDEPLPLQEIPYDDSDAVRPPPAARQLSDLFSDHLFALYELDSLALNSDGIPLSYVPSDGTTTPANVQLHNPPSLTLGSNTLSTSPLKRLKSLKNGIRKLSLLKMTSLLSVSLPVLNELPQAPPRPILSPLQTEAPCQDVSSLSSTGDSLRSSTFSSSAAAANGLVGGTTGSTPVGPTHVHSASQGLMSKDRRRTLSSSHSTLAASTPPLPLPIITLSENLSTTKEAMVDIEQNFFDNLGSSSAGGMKNLHQLTTSDELIEYSLYLNEHKRSVVGAYDATRQRLISSGWCSNHDLENLSLQRDSSVSQIDTKLLQIEEKLNLEFQLSMLNNTTHQMTHHKHLAAPSLRDTSLSPSLKVLESRCFAFPGGDEQ